MPGSEATRPPNSCNIAVGWTNNRKAETFSLGNSDSSFWIQQSTDHAACVLEGFNRAGSSARLLML